MSIVYVTRRAHFNAGHRLHNPERSDDWNRRVYGPCNNANGHGHNYVLDVTVAGEPDPETGYVIDLGILGRVVHALIVEKVDHQNLNLDVEFMHGIIPTTENFAVAIWRQLAGAIPSGKLFRVRLRETERNIVEYTGP